MDTDLHFRAFLQDKETELEFLNEQTQKLQAILLDTINRRNECMETIEYMRKLIGVAIDDAQ